MGYVSLKWHLLHCVLQNDHSVRCTDWKLISAAPRVSNIALINTERAYAIPVVNNNMNGIIDIFGRQNGKESNFF